MSNPVLTRPAGHTATPGLDQAQQRIAEAILDGGRHVVHGAPGSGKTHLAIAVTVAAAHRGGQPLLLVPTRTGAATTRAEVTRRIGRTLDAAVVRTPAALAFAILRLRASHAGEPAPTLVSGPEQDRVLADLLAGHAAGEGRRIDWPEGVGPATWQLRAFRNELRDVLMRAAEIGLDGADLADLGRARQRPEWVAAGQVLTEYTQVMALGQTTPDRGARYDAAGIVDAAVRALAVWESDLPGVPRPRWSLVLHDDYQDATMATARLLSALGDDGAALAVFGEADAAVQSFRGGVPTLLATAAAPARAARSTTAAGPGADVTADGAWGAREHVLDRVWRHDESLRTPVQRLTAALPVLAAGARREAPGLRSAADDEAQQASVGHHHEGADGDLLDGAVTGLRTAVLGSPAQEVAYVARQLRIARLRQHVPWSQMAVIARSSSQLGAIRRGLRACAIPLAAAAADRPLREAPAVRALLAALRAVLPGAAPGLDVPTAVELLCGPIGSMDTLTLRGLRRHLRSQERQAGGHRPSGELLLDILTDPGAAEHLPPRYRRGPVAVARVLAAARQASTDAHATAETVLWAAWEATGLAGTWQHLVLTGGTGADRADADLDAVLALFRAAEQFVDRTAHSAPAAFIDHILAQDFPADTLAARGQMADAVAVHTPAGAVGQQWDVVAVVGVQEDVWPDLRIRDSLLGAAALAEIATTRDVPGQGQDEAAAVRQARQEVADGELRGFVSACSRARRVLHVTAVLDDDERPSVFLDLLTDGADHQVEVVPAPLDLRGLVGQLRAALRPVLTTPDSTTPAPEAAQVAHASEAAAVLSHLARHGVSAADPQHWGGLHEPSTTSPILPGAQVPTISPSAVEQILTCPLRWVLTRNGGEPGTSDAQQLGNLIHQIAAAHPHGGLEAMQQMLAERWPDLGLPPGWAQDAQRRRAEQMITRLAQYMATRPGPVHVEVPFTVPVGQVRLRGQVDRVEHLDDGRVRIVDIKTGKSAESVARAEQNPQLAAYQIAADAGAFGPFTSAGAALIYPGTSARSVTVRTQPALTQADDPRWAHELLAEAGQILASGTFDARPNEHCRTCPVRTSCPALPTGARVEPPR